MLGNGDAEASAGKKRDSYDSMRFAISERYPRIDLENVIKVARVVKFLISTSEKRTTTYEKIMKETGLSKATIRHICKALESLKYLTVYRKKSGKCILVNGKRFYGRKIGKEIERCLQELSNVANDYEDIRNVVGDLPEKARVYFENNDRRSVKTYNEAVKRLEKAELKILPLIEWKNAAFRIGLGPRFYYDFEW